MKRTSGNLVPSLLTKVPELQQLFDKHIRANEEILPHVFFGDVTRFALSEASKRPQPDTLLRLPAFLEDAMCSGDADVRELISVSFLENLGPPSDEFHVVRSMLGSNLRAELARHWKEEPTQ